MLARGLPLFASLALVAVSAGCGAWLRHELKHERHLVATQDCAQGPLEIEVTPLGADLGESWELKVCSPRLIDGQYRVLDDERVLQQGRLKLEQTWDRERNGEPPSGWRALVHVEEPENERCLLEGPAPAPEHVQEPEEPAEPRGWEPVPPPAGVAPPPFGSESGPSPAPTPEPPSGPASLRDVPVEELHCSHTVRVARSSWEISRSDERRAEGPVTIVLWSKAPNDLEGVRFVLKQSAATPSKGSAAEYREQLKEKEDARVDAATRKAEKEAARQAFCRAHRDDWLCWGVGGYEAHRARKRFFAGVRRWWAGDRAAPRERAARARRAAAPAPAPAPPTCIDDPGPPPTSPLEDVPPRPAADAEWVPGYAVWRCTAWERVPGQWRLPEGGPEEERWNLVAPSPPPPPPAAAQRPPPPTVGVWVWVRGVWVYDGQRFVWVEGGYRPAATR